jgi:hypothetical protein
MQDMHHARGDERDPRPLVRICRRPRWARRFRLLAVTEQLDDRLPDGFDFHASRSEHFRRDAVLLVQQPEQQVLGADVVVRQSLSFISSVLEHTFAGGAELDFVRRGDFFVACKASDDLGAKVAELVTRAREDPAAKPAAFVQHSKEHVLGLNGARAELAGLGAGVKQDPRRSCREAIEHTLRGIHRSRGVSEPLIGKLFEATAEPTAGRWPCLVAQGGLTIRPGRPRHATSGSIPSRSLTAVRSLCLQPR